mmetsp:Transcript_27378/g.55111  ORF Transcript_27378/g.55111 Transcript_27378/m.55111 type:complete len:222 (-) Transcript_27378:289-954(-)
MDASDVATKLTFWRRDKPSRSRAHHGEPGLELRPKARHVRDVHQNEDRCAEIEQVDVRQHLVKLELLVRRSIKLRHAAPVNPHKLDLSVSLQEVTQGEKLRPGSVRILVGLPPVRNREVLAHERAIARALARERLWNEPLRTITAKLLKAGELPVVDRFANLIGEHENEGTLVVRRAARLPRQLQAERLHGNALSAVVGHLAKQALSVWSKIDAGLFQLLQ